MCGINGILTNNSVVNIELCIRKMNNALIHRGPDSSGIWVNEGSKIALGHRRLSILDLSNAGNQPMTSRCQRYILTFNGEIYNHLDLRKELNGPWLGYSDTETLLEAFSYWGIEKTLSKTVGMFAIGLWDVKENSLYLARDRFGEKPLYYGWVDNVFLFSSELKAIRSFPNFSNPISINALSEYLRYVYVPTPLSIYKNIYKLQPGCLLKLTFPFPSEALLGPFHPGYSSKLFTLTRWWSLSKVIKSTRKNLIKNEEEAKFELEKRLIDAVRIQLLSDVPLGAFLSGGIDSSLIVSMMQSQSLNKINTFSVGFEEIEFNEAPFAASIAKYLNTSHNELIVTALDALRIIPQIPDMYDEPFADSSQIPTHLLSFYARKKVSVILSGDGADESFGGYNRYFWGPKIWNKLSWLPFDIRKKMGKLIHSIPLSKWNIVQNWVGVSHLGDKAWKLANRLDYVKGIDSLYWSLVTEISDPEAYLTNNSVDLMRQYDSANFIESSIPIGLSHEELMMYYDTNSYLTDDILCKLDRASMYCSLEARTPFLDHRVVEFAWTLPSNFKIRGNVSKWVLREILKKYVPKNLTDRPKSGFAIPIGIWLKGPLRDWAEDLLNTTKLNNEGYLNSKAVRKLWFEHTNGQRDHTTKLWAILMFQAWLRKNL